MLPTEAFHADFQFRFRHLGTRDGLGDWFVDDISLTTGPAQIEGTLWYDSNTDQVIDANELLLSNWTVFDDANSNGLLDDGEVSTTTDEQGYYVFSNLSPGLHRIQTIVPDGWRDLSPSGGNFVATAANRKWRDC